MAKPRKTNAVRLVEQENTPFTLYEYTIEDGLIDGFSVAEKNDQDVKTVFKTLVTQAQNQQIFVFLLPLTKELNLKQAAKIAQVKKIDLLPLQELTAITGYVRGGCSPIGMKKKYPTFLDESANQLTEIIVSAGRPGLQMAIAPKDLIDLTHATVRAL